MKYYDELECAPAHSESVAGQVPLSVLLSEAIAKAGDALSMAQKINNHLFADGTNKDSAEKEPICFRDFMIRHNCCLTELCNELASMMAKLGV